MSDDTHTAQGSAATAAKSVKFTNLSFLQQLGYVGKSVLCICSFGFIYPNIFSD